jgi:lipoprotein-anchoring transpeptidase ErfK/SrfK
MKSSTLESKTIRPGLGSYSFYMSDRRPAPARRTKTAKKSTARRSKRHPWNAVLLAAAVTAALLFGYNAAASPSTPSQSRPPAATAKTPATKPQPTATAPAATPKPAAPAAIAQTACSGNSLSQLIIVSISQRHLWACQAGTVAYDSSVVTGMENLAADLTPTGTYHIYSKQTNVTLRGSDSTGSWDDPVYYWMPFLHNQYGSYGFHDATWRADSDFGNISPYSNNASHGCVELPLATAKWLYDWADVGTTVTINS